jgi:predicted AlkP superfamily phosphohydrolase/phosphomutase/tetratricopeptide (TPR) repeat protein
MTSTKKVLIIGWDAADWKILHPLIDAGKLPTISSLVNKGVIGNLATMYPQLSPMLWTTIATGKRPFKHGIHGFIEPDPTTGSIRPITNLSRKTKAIWNILSQNNKKCIVVGWWPSHPAEPINGVMVSNYYQKITSSNTHNWTITPETIYPERLERNLAQLRCHPLQLDAGHILPFVPKLAEIDQSKDKRIGVLARIIAENCSILNAAQAIMHHEAWDFAAIFFDGIDHFCHGFMKYHPPKMDSISEKDFELYKNVIESGYILHDIFLKKLLKETTEDTTLIIVSDHGFHSDHLRPISIPIEPAGPAVQHRPHGIFLMHGPSILEDEIIFGATLPDICPTILNIFDLPYGLDMDGRVLINAFKHPKKIQSIDSWDTIEGKSGEHPKDKILEPIEAQEVIKQLELLGYIEALDMNIKRSIPKTIAELDYNLARSYMYANRYKEACSLLETLTIQWPDEYRFGIHLIECHLALKKPSMARKVLESILMQKDKNVANAQNKLKELNNKYEHKTDLETSEIRQIKQLKRKASINSYAVEYLKGLIFFSENNYQQSLEHLQKAELIDNSQSGLYLKLAEIHIKLKRWKDAKQAYMKTLSIDSNSPYAYLGLCKYYLYKKKFEEAAQHSLKAIGLLYFFPQAHFYLGVALYRMRKISQAVDAFKVAVFQNPNFKKAYFRLAFIYQWHLSDSEKAIFYKKLGRNVIKTPLTIQPDKYMPIEKNDHSIQQEGPIEKYEFLFSGHKNNPFIESEVITVVTGLPRSGTSMLMQMLNAAGMPIFTDGKRTPDKSNPQGYFESEKVKKIHKNNSWLIHVKGKAVKIVVPLIKYLSPKWQYRIIFIERDMDDIIRSQARMLHTVNQNEPLLTNDRLGQIYRVQLEQSKKLLIKGNVAVLFIKYDYIRVKPMLASQKINQLFQGKLNETAMANVVLPFS